eukprot:12404270-Karenia_brevis.AAC.1
MGASSWEDYGDVKIGISGQAYVECIASGHGFNCLIDTLQQQLNFNVDARVVRSQLEDMFSTGVGIIRK